MVTVNPTADLMTLEDFADCVAAVPTPDDIELDNLSFEWSLDDKFELMLGDMRAGALPAYQAKSLMGQPGIDLTGQRRLRKLALSGDSAAEMVLRRQVAQLNVALRGHTFATSPVLARTYLDDDGVTVVGGLVTPRYTPITHKQLLDLMLENVGFDGAMVHRNRVDASRLDATLMLDGDEWKVDGGIKRGMRLKNGQFGDYAYGWAGMLFHLLCTNGMMDVVDMEKSFKRHLGVQDIDLAADLVAAMQRGDAMFERSRASVEVEVDVTETLIELHRRDMLSRGALRESVERMEDMGGVGAEQRARSLWGVAQVITAAARKYSFTQYDQMGRLAGRLVFEGVDAVMATRPVKRDAPSRDEVYEEFFLEAA